jgi:ketopantoate reductase
LLKLTVIAQPDLKSLLMHPALRRLIMDIALQASQLATAEALAQMQEEMRRMQEKMQSRMDESMRVNITKTMEIELNPLARNSAAYSLGELTRMKRKQIVAYNGFAPAIGAPEIPGPHGSGMPDDDGVD